MPELAAEHPPQGSTPESMPAMSFLEHLEELRRRLIYSIVAVGVAFCFCWAYAERIYDLVQRPVIEALQKNGVTPKLTFLNPTEPFNLYIKTAFVAGLFAASPFVLYQVWMFISPGLYRREKRYVLPFMSSTILLFLAGGYFGYKMVFPAALEFLISYGKQFQPMITISEYSDLFLTVIIGLGVVFEMPILVFFLARLGIVSERWLLSKFKYAVLVIFIIAAVITPTPDIATQCVFALPMIGLYLLGILVAWIFRKRDVAA